MGRGRDGGGLGRAIARAVVDEDDLEVRIGLREDARDRIGERRLGVARREQHRRRGALAAQMSLIPWIRLGSSAPVERERGGTPVSG